MADPFARQKKNTAGQFVASGSFGTPIQKEWSLENAVDHGYKASGWVYSCCRILATHISSWPWVVVQKNADGEQEVLPDHPAAALVENPNEHHTREFQMYFRALHLLLCGNALDKLVMVGKKPEEIWPLRPDSTTPIPSQSQWVSGYEIRGRNGLGLERLEPHVVCHAMLPDPENPYWGMSPLRATSKTVDMDVSQVEWNRQLVDNDASPAGVFVDPNIHSEAERKMVKAAIAAKMSGPLSAREPLVLSGGAKWEQLGINPREMDWIESRKFTVGEICSAFGMLTSRFLQDAQTYANLEAAIKYEKRSGALPAAKTIGDGLGQRLLTLEERRAGLRLRPDTSEDPDFQDDVHEATKSYATLVERFVPPQMAAAIVNLPIGEIPDGDRSYRPAMLEEVGVETDEGDL